MRERDVEREHRAGRLAAVGGRPCVLVVERQRRLPQAIARRIRGRVEAERRLDAVEVLLGEPTRETLEERPRREAPVVERGDHRDGDAVIDAQERAGGVAVAIQHREQLALRAIGRDDRSWRRVDPPQLSCQVARERGGEPRGRFTPADRNAWRRGAAPDISLTHPHPHHELCCLLR